MASFQQTPCAEEDREDPTGPVGEGPRAIVVVRGALVRLRECRVDMDHGGERLYGDVPLHRENDLVDQVPRVGPDNVPSQDLPPTTGDYLDKPGRLPVSYGPVEPGERLAVDFHVGVLLTGLLLGEPDAGDLRVYEGGPRDDAVVGLRLCREEGVAQGDATLVLGHVGEEVLAGNVARGVDTPGCGAQMLVHLQAGLPELNARVLQRQRPGRGSASGGDQDLLRPYFDLLSALSDCRNDFQRGGCAFLSSCNRPFVTNFDPGLLGLVPAVESDAARDQNFPDERSDLGVLLRKWQTHRVEEGNVRAEARVDLGELAAYRPRTYDDDRAGQPTEPESLYVGEVPYLLKALYGWRNRVRASGEDDAARAEAVAVHRNFLR